MDFAVGPLTPPEAIKSPVLMSATERFSIPKTVASAFIVTVTAWPSFVFTVRLLPSSLSTVPATRTGGGECVLRQRGHREKPDEADNDGQKQLHRSCLPARNTRIQR